MDHDELRQLFFDEAGELCRQFEDGVLRLEANPDDREVLHSVFRAVHNLKGGAGMMRVQDVVVVAHRLETLLDEMRTGRRAVTRSAIDVLLGSTDVLRAVLTSARTGAMPSAEERAATDELNRRVGGLMGEGDGATEYVIDFRPPVELFRRGLDPLALIRDLEDMGNVIAVAVDDAALPALAELDPETCYLGWRIRMVTARPVAEITACFDYVADPDAISIVAAQSPAPAAESGAAPTGDEDASTPAARAGTAVDVHRRRATDHEDVIRVPVEKLDRLVDLVGEMVTTQSAIAQRAGASDDGELAETVAQMDRQVRELHAAVMRVRMVAVRSLFARFPRLVRDLGATTGKDVALDVSGEDTELDKTVIERLADPLTHLVRNAIDHGLESPERRRAAGKPPTGRVRLAAWQQGGSVYLDVADDGAGLDRARIRARAEANGLVAPGDVLADDDVLALIFRPGFSTAPELTELSGRGVGMDVVRRSVEALGGTITMETTPGVGTRFRLKLPLTLAMLDGQLLRVGALDYVLPLGSITESLRPSTAALRTIAGGNEVVSVRESALPVLRLGRLLGVASAETALTDGLLVVVEHDGRRAALAVDDLGAQQQVVIKSLGRLSTRVNGVSGATVLGDGRVALILDVPGLLAMSDARIRRVMAG
jgi:two-component system chemotaxis sensor kinase CheA